MRNKNPKRPEVVERITNTLRMQAFLLFVIGLCFVGGSFLSFKKEGLSTAVNGLLIPGILMLVSGAFFSLLARNFYALKSWTWPFVRVLSIFGRGLTWSTRFGLDLDPKEVRRAFGFKVGDDALKPKESLDDFGEKHQGE